MTYTNVYATFCIFFKFLKKNGIFCPFARNVIDLVEFNSHALAAFHGRDHPFLFSPDESFVYWFKMINHFCHFQTNLAVLAMAF